jgi:hypothetical protein
MSVQVQYGKKGWKLKACYISQDVTHRTPDIYSEIPKQRNKEDMKEREEARVMPQKIRSDTLTVNGRKTEVKETIQRRKKKQKMR